MCIFCGERPVDSKEHFWPVWMASALPELPGSYSAHLSDSHPPTGRANTKARRQNGRLNTLKVRAVCAPCNNGWMNRLEGAVRPLLEPMIAGLPSILSTEAQSILARWISTKTIAAEHFHRQNAITPATERRALMEGAMPTGFRVYVGQHIASPVGYRRSSHTIHRPGAGDLSSTALNGPFAKNIQQITFTIGSMFAHVNASVANVCFEEMVIVHFYQVSRIWPSQSDNFPWPPTRPLTEGQLNDISKSLERITTLPHAKWL